MKPTQEQEERLWKWCGLRWFWNHNPKCQCGAVDDNDSNRSWHYKDGGEWKLATRFWGEEMAVDLNSLFEYAMSRLNQAQYYEALKSIFVKSEDPALALFWALDKVRETE